MKNNRPMPKASIGYIKTEHFTVRRVAEVNRFATEDGKTELILCSREPGESVSVLVDENVRKTEFRFHVARVEPGNYVVMKDCRIVSILSEDDFMAAFMAGVQEYGINGPAA